jgi:hypothetical protein
MPPVVCAKEELAKLKATKTVHSLRVAAFLPIIPLADLIIILLSVLLLVD